MDRVCGVKAFWVNALPGLGKSWILPKDSSLVGGTVIFGDLKKRR